MTAFRATYSDWKLIKTRGVVQVVMEIPLADADAAYDVLGGMPVHGKERWFGIAALKSPAEEDRGTHRQKDSSPSPHPGEAKRNWRDIPPPQQAGIRCDEPAFAAFLKEQRPDDWQEEPDPVDCVYLICGITSRSELATNHKARVIWKMLDDQYSAWKALEHA
jgi:hypothetical protein